MHARSYFTCHPVPSAQLSHSQKCLTGASKPRHLPFLAKAVQPPPLPAHYPPPSQERPSTGLPLPLAISFPPEVNAGMLPSVVSPSPRINNMATAALQGWTLARRGAAYTSHLPPQHHRSSRASVIFSSRAKGHFIIRHSESLPISREGS